MAERERPPPVGFVGEGGDYWMIDPSEDGASVEDGRSVGPDAADRENVISRLRDGLVDMGMSEFAADASVAEYYGDEPAQLEFRLIVPRHAIKALIRSLQRMEEVMNHGEG